MGISSLVLHNLRDTLLFPEANELVVWHKHLQTCYSMKWWEKLLCNYLEVILVGSSCFFRDSTEIEYEILSAIAFVWQFPKNPATHHMDFDHRPVPEGNYRTWTLNCAVTEFAAFSYGWEPQLCQTTIINSTRTRCECSTSGTFAVLLTKRQSLVSRNWTTC